MHYKLVLENHVDGVSGGSWTFRPPAVLGREPGSGLCIDHESISRKHCQFTLSPDEALVVKDMDSMNGTYVDDRRVQQATLMPGQTLQIGALVLKVEFTEDAVDVVTPPKTSGNVNTTQPMETFRPVPLPPEKPWWKKLFG